MYVDSIVLTNTSPSCMTCTAIYYDNKYKTKNGGVFR